MGTDLRCWLKADGPFTCLIFVVKSVGYSHCDHYGCSNVLHASFCSSQGSIVKIEKAYDVFLGEFPLCYGYWKKYADHETKLGSPEKTVDVYERAVKSVTYSVDIWMHYCAYAMEKFDSPENTRRCVAGSYCHSRSGVLLFT